jgi:polyisoprenoid-binding protein YceI
MIRQSEMIGERSLKEGHMTTATGIQLPAGTWTFDKHHTTIGFVARHMMVTKVRGTFGEFDGKVEVAEDPADSRVDVSIAAASVSTGSPERNAHMLSPDFFDVENFPELKFVSTGIGSDGDGWRLLGDLTIKDVTRPVVLDVTFEGTATNPLGKTIAAFTASTEVDREDWGLTWNLALETGGVLVSKKARIEIETELIKV